jgi:2-polyprenyl-3-methyl-5-hydroxy-6-metoxy-1,4-benzoquinol methylase
MSNTENKNAWEKEHVNAWVERFGTPHDYANKIAKDPLNILGPLAGQLGAVEGKKILNVMGSNGNKAVALSLLGADVTVVDFSLSNKTYAEQLAEEAKVSITYVVEDVLKMAQDASFDIAFAEMGILHYFTDLSHFFDMMFGVLINGGIAVVRDFHPVSTKLIVSRGSTAKVRKHKVEGDYFDTALTEKIVSYGKYLEDETPEKVYLRNWTLGEIVTAAAQSGFRIEALIEEPNLSSDVFDKGIPKTFLLKMIK